MKEQGTQTAVLELSPAASRMLDALVDLAHLDDRMLDQVSDRMLDEPPGPSRALDLQAVRRIVAIVLDENRDRLTSDQQRLIDQEWPALFH